MSDILRQRFLRRFRGPTLTNNGSNRDSDGLAEIESRSLNATP